MEVRRQPTLPDADRRLADPGLPSSTRPVRHVPRRGLHGVGRAQARRDHPPCRFVSVVLAATLVVAGCDGDDRGSPARLPDAAAGDGTLDGGRDALDLADGPGADSAGDPGGDELGHPLAPIELVSPTGERLRLDPSSLDVSLASASGDERLTFSLAGLALGLSDADFDARNYDPVFLYEPATVGGPGVPADLRWALPTRVVSVDDRGDSATLRLALDGDGAAQAAGAALEVAIAGDGTFRLTLRPDVGLPVLYTRVSLPVGADEAFYGLGEVFDQVEQRGRRRAMHLRPAAELESSSNDAHVPVPFLVSTKGWGLFVASHHPGVFDVAAHDAQQVTAVFTQPELAFTLYAADHPLQVVERHSAVAGRISLPPPWALGMWLWRNENESGEEVLADARALRDLGIAASGIWIDRPWQTYHESFAFDPVRFPSPGAMVAELNDLGFRVAVWSSPYLATDAPEYATARDNEWLVEGTAFINPFGVPVDFTHPEALAWWQDRVAVFAAGEGIDAEGAGAAPIDGFKLDYGEDILTGIEGARTRFDFANGEDERTMHHRYSDLYHVAFGQPLGQGAGFLIARSGTWEGQRFITCIWPGDLDNAFQRRGEEGHVGGLPAAVIAGQSLAASGYPLFASDTGGYLHGRPTSEVLMRWAAYAWLLPVMQLGGAGRNHNPWDFTAYGDSVFDEQTLEVVRGFANEHMRWFPYLYSLVDRAHQTGRPITPPFGLAWPEEGHHPDDQFAVGDHVMAAPIVGPSAEREVWLPSGRWVDWWTGEPSQGPTRLTVSVPYDRVPLWLGEGAIVPMLRPGVDTLAPAEGEGVESWADQPGWLVTRVVPAPGARFTLHDGGHIAVETDWNRVSVTLVNGSLYDGHELVVWSEVPPTEVGVDGRDAAHVEEAAVGVCDDCWSRSGQWTTVVPAMAADGTARVELSLSE